MFEEDMQNQMDPKNIWKGTEEATEPNPLLLFLSTKAILAEFRMGQTLDGLLSFWCKRLGPFKPMKCWDFTAGVTQQLF